MSNYCSTREQGKASLVLPIPREKHLKSLFTEKINPKSLFQEIILHAKLHSEGKIHHPAHGVFICTQCLECPSHGAYFKAKANHSTPKKEKNYITQ